MATAAMATNTVFRIPAPSASALLDSAPALRVNDQDVTVMTVRG